MIKIVVLFGCEIWAVTEEIKSSCNTSEQNILRSIHGSIRDQMAA